MAASSCNITLDGRILGFLLLSLSSMMLRAQTPVTPANQHVEITTTATGAEAALIKIRIPRSAKSTVSIHLNGRDIARRFTATDCQEARCQQANLSVADGMRAEKNVITVDAGGGISARLRFGGSYETTRYPQVRARLVNSSDVSTTGVDAPFLPPTISVTTNQPGGWQGNVDPVNSPWFRVGNQGYPAVQPSGSCSGAIYLAVVLDRQTLTEKTTAPVSSPQCFASAVALKTYLHSLDPTDLAFVGTKDFANADSGLDTSDIGGTTYHADPLLPQLQGYLAIGVGGATPGTAYESLYVSKAGYETVLPFATGILDEDAYGNYNFQSSDVVEYSVSPNDPAYLTPNPTSVVSIQNFRGGTVKNFVYTPPSGTNGYWLLLVSRNTLNTYPYDCAQGELSQDGTARYIPNCGTFYSTGSADPATSKAAYQQLASDLSAVNGFQLAFLTTVGQASYGGTSNSIWQVGGFNGAYGGPSNGFTEFATAVESLGGSPNLAQSLLSQTSAYTLVTSPGVGGPLTGSAVESTTALSAQGQTGLVHGILQRNLNGLFLPQQTNQETFQLFQAKNGNNSPEFKLTEVALQQPVEWPSSSTSNLLPQADSLPGQIAAYRYLSFVLLHNIYMRGSAGPHLDDIHYFFTGSNNTAISIGTYDPLSIAWPTPQTFGPYVLPCNTITNNTTCTVAVFNNEPPLVFTQNDFVAVRNQLSTEIRYLTDTLRFLVTGSTNMKAVIAGGSTNAGLALTGAAATILGSKLVPAPPTTVVTTSWQNIVSMIGGVASLASAIPGLGEVAGIVQLGESAGKIFGGTSSAVGGIAGIAGGAGQITSSSTSSSLPSAFGRFATDIGDLANGSMQGQLSSGFDTVTDSITSDWGRLSTIGPMTVDTSNPVFFSPNQVAQNVAVKGLTQAASRSFYLALMPDFYHVHYWQGVSGDTNLTNDIPDMGYWSSSKGITAETFSCSAFYLNPQHNAQDAEPNTGLGTIPPDVSIWFPSLGGTPEYYDKDYSSYAIDFYVIAGATTGSGTDGASIQVLDPSLAANLFTASGLNLPLAEFVTRNGPMSAGWVDAHATNPAGHHAYSVCNARLYPSGSSNPEQPGDLSTGPSAPLPGTATVTTLSAPTSSVLGENVDLTATVAAGSSLVTTGAINFLDNGAIVATLPVGANGIATATLLNLALGAHALQAKYVAVDPYVTSSSAVSQLGVYAEAPTLNLSSSAQSVQLTSGASASPVTLQVTSMFGLAGTVNYTCVGLPSGMSCNFSPAQSSLSPGGIATTTLTITAPSNSSALSTFRIGGILSCLLLPFSLFRLLQLRDAGRTFQKTGLLLLSTICVCVAVTGCGGGSPRSPAKGTSTLLVSAASGSVTKVLPLTVTVQ